MQAAVRTLCDHDPDWLFRRLLREARLWMDEERAKLATLLQDSSAGQVQDTVFTIAYVAFHISRP